LSTIGDLTKELNTAKQRIAQLEQLNQTLQANQQLHTDEQTQKFHSLQQAMITLLSCSSDFRQRKHIYCYSNIHQPCGNLIGY
jgi:hypothetical protein